MRHVPADVPVTVSRYGQAVGLFVPLRRPSAGGVQRLLTAAAHFRKAMPLNDEVPWRFGVDAYGGGDGWRCSITVHLWVGRFCPKIGEVTGQEFIRKVKTLGKKHGLAVRLDSSRGKGSHQTLYYGTAFTVVRNPRDELKTGTLHGMCGQLGIKVIDL